MEEENELDILVIGAGFSGLYTLHKLREEGFKVKVFEAGSDIGGTWYWNCYPGARVDSTFPTYQFTDEDIMKDFVSEERFPGYQGLRKYFRHVDNKLDLSKDIDFNMRVTSAEFDSSRNQWEVKCENRQLATWAKHLLLATGFSVRKYIPPFKGLENFKGEWYHTANWPQDGVNLKGKRVAVIGTGASGVQVIQEICQDISHLTVYQRTPNLALPMGQVTRSLTDQSQIKCDWKFQEMDECREIIKMLRSTFGGMDVDFLPKNTFDVSPEERRAFYQELWRKGSFFFWLGTYQDILFNKEANDTAYDFWCEKTQSRINSQIKKEMLAPKIGPHAFGTKRPCLEQRYYEVFNQDNVDLVNIRDSPIIGITEKGVETEKEGVVEVDVLIMATGFDSLTGGILDIKIKNGKGESIQEKWKNGCLTYFGLAVSDFPNMFFIYGPQSPTPLSNGPTIIEIQVEWMTQLLVDMRNKNVKTIQATKEAEANWVDKINLIWNSTLFAGTDSWYQGANIPGKKIEALAYAGGIPGYIKELEECKNNNYNGFVYV